MALGLKNYFSKAAGVLFLLTLLLITGVSNAQTNTRDGVFTQQQAVSGGALYLRSCVECHGITLAGGEAGPALVGGAFWSQWQDQSLAAFYQITASTMPVNNPNGFSPEQYTDVVAFMLQQNGLPVGEEPLTANVADMVAITMQLLLLNGLSIMNGWATTTIPMPPVMPLWIRSIETMYKILKLPGAGPL